MSKFIEIKNLYYTAASGNKIFEDVEAEFYEGERVAIIGPLGSGKATLLRLLLGLEKPQNGAIYLFGKDIGRLERLEIDILRQGIGVVFENASLISNLKVIENVMLPLQYHTNLTHDAIMERAVFLLGSVGYKGDMWELPGPLPSYTKKTIALAKSMALDPIIMIYDRLMEGLDERQSLELIRFVDGFHKAKKDRLSIMIANDERGVRDIIPDRVLRIENRRII
ncbi:MAG: ATP-binding cassette domain-containing protein [Deltaproteobacteria bacterium]